MIQGSDWTILQEGMVLSSTDDDEVITMEILCNCLIQRESGVNQKTVKYVEFVEFQLTVHGFFFLNPRVHVKHLHPNDGKWWWTDRTVKRHHLAWFASFQNSFLTFFSKATNWCTGSLTDKNENIKHIKCLLWR